MSSLLCQMKCAGDDVQKKADGVDEVDTPGFVKLLTESGQDLCFADTQTELLSRVRRVSHMTTNLIRPKVEYRRTAHVSKKRQALFAHSIAYIPRSGAAGFRVHRNLNRVETRCNLTCNGSAACRRHSAAYNAVVLLHALGVKLHLGFAVWINRI